MGQVFTSGYALYNHWHNLYIPERDIFTCNTILYTCYTTFIRMGVMYLHGRTFCTLTDTISIQIGAMYLQASSVPIGVMRLHARRYCTLIDTISVHWCNVFTCKNVPYTGWYNLCTHWYNVFTCKNVQYSTYVDTTFICVGAINLQKKQECSAHSLIWSPYPLVQCVYMQEHSAHRLIRSLYWLVQCINIQDRSVHMLIQL